jgi:predicted DNA-binding transcriptional regulator AlpA
MAQHIHRPQSNRIVGADVPVMSVVVYTVAEFCAAHKISRSKLYELWRAGIGPRRVKVGAKSLITGESAYEWRRQLEARGRT